MQYNIIIIVEVVHTVYMHSFILILLLFKFIPYNHIIAGIINNHCNMQCTLFVAVNDARHPIL